jgi:hypothetical protein
MQQGSPGQGNLNGIAIVLRLPYAACDVKGTVSHDADEKRSY